MKLPPIIQQEIEQIRTQLSPKKVNLRTLLFQQADYNKKAVMVQGTVTSVVSIDEIDQQTVGTWFMNLPTTVKSNASATYFYLQDEIGEEILVKYPADLDVSVQDKLILEGIFSAHGVTIENKGLLRTKKEEALNDFGEPFIGAIIVENQTKQKIEYVRQNI